MARAKYLGSAFAAELVIAVTLGASMYAQVAGPSPSLNIPGATDQAAPLSQIVVTGYIIPRIGEGPQPVMTLDQDFISKQGDQTVAEVLQRLPMTANNFGPTTDGFELLSLVVEWPPRLGTAYHPRSSRWQAFA